MEPNSQSVEFEVIRNGVYEIRYNSPLLRDHHMDYTEVADEVKPGQSRRLLAAAACSCFTATVDAAIRGRGCEPRSVRGAATAMTEVDPESGRPRVSQIDIVVEVDLPDGNQELLDHIREIAARGCLVTRSLEPAIRIRHEIVQKLGQPS